MSDDHAVHAVHAVHVPPIQAPVQPPVVQPKVELPTSKSEPVEGKNSDFIVGVMLQALRFQFFYVSYDVTCLIK